jgi:hypothetical protein
MTVNNATGWYSNGEVEDYRVFVDVLLPIQLLTFTAGVDQNKKIALNWKTGQEINFTGFDIERSQERSSWDKIGFVASTNGQQINTYSFLDADPYPGKSYYRLKLIYADGNFSYSEIRMVQLESKSSGLEIMPNPVRDHASLQFTLAKNETVQIYVIDASGRNVLYKQVSSTAGVNRIEIDNWNRLAPGTYFVQLFTPTTKMSSKVTVQ